MNNTFEIYITTNIVNGKKYIGLHSLNNSPRHYLGSGTLLKQAIKKYGVKNFKKETLAITFDLNEANELERFFIKEFNAVESDSFYNLSYGGEFIAGRVHSIQTIDKIRDSKRKNYVDNPNLRYMTGSANRGKVMPESTKTALMCANTGRMHTDETREKLSKSAKLRYEQSGLQYPSLVNSITGEIIEPGSNLTLLSKRLKVNCGNLHSVIIGKRKSCSGWRIL